MLHLNIAAIAYPVIAILYNFPSFSFQFHFPEIKQSLTSPPAGGEY
ncbi:hypothetical protein [Niastella caeni]|nr:hypothetical protein [Niastella caeni]